MKDEAMYKDVYITPDLTHQQQEVDKNLRDNLKKIKEAGEKDAKIKKGKIIKNGMDGQVLYQAALKIGRK